MAVTRWVTRNAGAVVSTFANRQPGRAEEELASDHPDVVAFESPPPPTADQRAARDLDRDLALRALAAETLVALNALGANITAPQWRDRLIARYKTLAGL